MNEPCLHMAALYRWREQCDADTIWGDLWAAYAFTYEQAAGCEA